MAQTEFKARKTYVCDGCGDNITRGDFYHKNVILYDYNHYGTT